jgi:hypothetical protein
MILLVSKVPEPLARTLVLHLDDINQASTTSQIAYYERQTATSVQPFTQQEMHC